MIKSDCDLFVGVLVAYSYYDLVSAVVDYFVYLVLLGIVSTVVVVVIESDSDRGCV